MIRFLDVGNKIRDLESLSSVSGYKEIKPEGCITSSEADDFWESLFSGEIKETKEADSDTFISEVYGRDEEEFSFEIDLQNSEIQSALKSFIPENWENLSEQEKIKAMYNFDVIIARELGLQVVPEIRFYKSSANDCGAFVPEKNVIMVNKNGINDPVELIDTLAHELRHAFQYQRALCGETHMDSLYAYNYDHYITPIINENGVVGFIDYQDQLIEAEARAFAKLFRNEVCA